MSSPLLWIGIILYVFFGLSFALFFLFTLVLSRCIWMELFVCMFVWLVFGDIASYPRMVIGSFFFVRYVLDGTYIDSVFLCDY